MSIRTPALAGGGELCPLHPFPVATVAASRQPPPFSPSPFPSTIKSRPCQSSRRSHESLSAACSSPEPSPRLLAPATFRPGLAPAASQTGQRGLGQGRAREAEYACSWSPGAVLPRRNFASPPPVGGTQAGSLRGSFAWAGAGCCPRLPLWPFKGWRHRLDLSGMCPWRVEPLRISQRGCSPPGFTPHS